MRLPCLFLLLIIFSLSGCARAVQQAAYLPATQLPADAQPAPLMFRGAEFVLPVGADIGFERQGKWCGWPRYPVNRMALKDVIVKDSKDLLKQTFREALEGQGYDVTGGLELAYDLEDEDDRAEYSVTAKIRNVDLEVCEIDKDETALFFANRPGTKGEFFIEVDWTVYDALHRRVAYKATTKGYTKRKQPNKEGLALMFTDAFAMAAHNLGADPAFANLVARGIPPQQDKSAAVPERPRLFDPRETATLPPLPLSHAKLENNIAPAKAAALTVQKFGHGSGFFITRQGHLLTTADAVGEGLRTRIITDNGTTLTAEVLRIDKMRNVALLKLEDMPQGFVPTVLPLRPAVPGIGEKIYAISTPGSIRKTAASLTGGIVSALRENIRHNGAKQDFLLADITMGKGSEGGMLLDKNGNVIAMAAGGEGTAGLQYFIPIGEALRALDITAPGL